MKKVREITPVHSREDKRQTYKKHLQQYKKAVNNEFYFEAILIDYACLEDRLRYMLYYLGVIQSEQDYKINDPQSIRTKAFRTILHEHVNSKANMTINAISGKCNIVKAVFRLVADPAKPDKSRKMEVLLYSKLNDRERAQQILGILEQIGEWCGYRNEIIHSLMNKNLDSLNEHIREKAEAGFQLFRQLDNQVQWVKRKEIRKSMKLDR